MLSKMHTGFVALACIAGVASAHAAVTFGTIDRNIFAEAQGSSYFSDSRSNATTGPWSDSLSLSQNGAPGGGIGSGSGSASQTSTINNSAIVFAGSVSRGGLRQGNFGSGVSALTVEFFLDIATQVDAVISRSGAAQLAFSSNVDGVGFPLGASSRLLAAGSHTLEVRLLASRSDNIADLTGNFSLTFVPAPGTACVFACAALLACRRRR